MILEEFLEELFGEQNGFVYSPIKKKTFSQKFFEWPTEKEQLVEHIRKHKEHDVYIAPALFSEKRIHPDTFKGTHHLWTEFDNGVPENPEIEPTIRIRSSLENKEHWYWRLNEFTTNVEKIIGATKRIAYAMDADLSGWDYATVLRPPETINQKRQLPVRVLATGQTSYSLDTFYTLPDPPKSATTIIDRKNLPKIDIIIAKYRWTDDALDLFTKNADELKPNKAGKRDRSVAMTALACECAEMGMSNEEIFVILDCIDNRWKKFTDRTDRDKRLLGIVSYARSKLATKYEKIDASTVYRFDDFMKTDIKLEWIIPGLVPVAGSGLIFGPSGVGKTTLALRMAMSIAKGDEEFLEWKIERQQRVLFLSLEMPHDELKEFFNDMKVPPEDKDKLQENFFVWPVGHAYPLDVRDQQGEVLKFIDEFKINLLVIDSLGVAMYGSMASDDDIKRLNSFLNEDLRKERNCGYLFIHHPRKPGSSEIKKPQDYYDVFGSIYIVNNAQTVINLNPVTATVAKVNIFKSRLSQDQQNFQVIRKSDRSFERGGNKKKVEDVTETTNILELGSGG